MSFWDSITSGIKSVATAVVNSPVGKVLDAGAYTFAHPIEAVKGIATGTFSKNETAFFAQPLSKQELQIGLATGGYVATALTAGTAAGRATVVTVAKSLVPTTGKQALVTAAVGLPLAGAAFSHPLQTIDVVTSTPGKLANVGANVANLIANPSVANAATIYKENPVIAGVTTAVAAGAAALAVGNVVSNITNTAAVKANTKATIESGQGSPTDQQYTTQPVTIVNQIPPIPPVAAPATVAPGGSQTPKKKAKKKAKAKKKTRRSKKKTGKKKKKSIKRRKS